MRLIRSIVSGYGATTLPALSEAVSIEKNASAAKYEAGRLTDLITKLSDVLSP
jgi:N-acetylated-alpha-linked acidic dipeptidase